MIYPCSAYLNPGSYVTVDGYGLSLEQLILAARIVEKYGVGAAGRAGLVKDLPPDDYNMKGLDVLLRIGQEWDGLIQVAPRGQDPLTFRMEA